MKLVVIIPALNEADTIGEVIDLIPKKMPGIDEVQTVVVDDGSTDETAKISKEHGAIVVSNYSQKRVSYSFQRGIAKALELGADVVTNIDADLQFNPKQIPDLVKHIVSGEYDFVAADRFTDAETGERRRPKNMPKSKYYANILGAWIVGTLSGYKFRDVTCGFRAYNRKALLALNIHNKYTYTQESFQLLAMKRMNITSVPVLVKYFPGRKSRVVTSFFKFLFSSAVNILRAFRDYAPLTFFGILGGVFMLLAVGTAVFVGVHYLNTGAFSPYISVALISGGSFIFGMFTWLIGLVADMLDRVVGNQEKIIELQKEIKYSKEK